MDTKTTKQKPLTSFALFVVLAALTFAGCRTGDALALWNDNAPSKAAIVGYVAAVTDASSPDYIPPERRIAVFDLDGTLFCETMPTYFDWLLFEYRVLDGAGPRFTPTAEQTAIARASRERGVLPPLNMAREQTLTDVYRGMTLDEFDAMAREFMDKPQPNFKGTKRGDMFYAPMVELVDYLVAHDFIVYVVSGSDRFLVRALVRGKLPVAPQHVIGSDSEVVAAAQNGADGLAYLFRTNDVPIMSGRAIVKNLQMNKVNALIRELGVKPVLAFGNSMTDGSMANYTISGNPYRAMAFMLLCDDTVRENGNLKKADRMRSACREHGWQPISMRDDWKTIYAVSP
ncbi:MAG: haloacid dehalogenase-like hydrolase [Kiritimatiellae bacterium]|nr:haloacid dehalogenase-like hydrolase [Kiritimatiellia bacterium]